MASTRYSATRRSFSAINYINPNGHGDASNVYTIGVGVTDDDTGTGGTSTSVTVNNLSPTVAVTLSNVSIDENGSTTLSGTITDTGSLDTFTLSLNWGDVLSPNNAQSFSLGTAALTEAANGINWNPATREFSLSHQYLDDNGSGDASNSYTINVGVQDDDTDTGSISALVTVNNVNPVLYGQTNTSPDCGHTFMGVDVVSIAAAFTDVGLLDTHSVSINWGDGITTTGTVTEVIGTGIGSVAGSHVYATGGNFYYHSHPDRR